MARQYIHRLSDEQFEAYLASLSGLSPEEKRLRSKRIFQRDKEWSRNADLREADQREEDIAYRRALQGYCPDPDNLPE